MDDDERDKQMQKDYWRLLLKVFVGTRVNRWRWCLARDRDLWGDEKKSEVESIEYRLNR